MDPSSLNMKQQQQQRDQQDYEELVMELSALEEERDGKRRQLEGWFEEMQTIKKRMEVVENELHEIDDRITFMEDQVRDFQNNKISPEEEEEDDDNNFQNTNLKPNSNSKLDCNDIYNNSTYHNNNNHNHDSSHNYWETQLTDPLTSPDFDNTDHRNNDNAPTYISTSSTSTSSAAAAAAAEAPKWNPNRLNIVSSSSISTTKSKNTLDAFFSKSENTSSRAAQDPINIHTANSYSHSVFDISTTATTTATATANTNININSNTATNKNTANKNKNNDLKFKGQYPWSREIQDLLRNTFHIPSFRDHQQEIINCTLSQKDVFVIMRTGGGKSLTYQLPAYYEKLHYNKITLVVSPLLSLIQDQVDQMNKFVPNSAISFTSGMGTREHAQRWEQVRNPNSKSLCMIFVTPEKVSKSNKLKKELEHLHDHHRLGRFVIDECHCASQWGHDFRPDYTKLSVLKRHFPSIPLMAVTATASEKVRQDCGCILNIDPNHELFQSTANRPNLQYSIVEKADAKQKVLEQMAHFIQTHYSKQAGIIYTFSRKEADDVADKLCDFGIVAKSYHSSVSPKKKEQIHNSWMNNRTQVVVATIAFGLGINKPDVRFVLHHSLSKSLESYYQESGRAGRDGKPAHCVLYYSPRDVPRMLCMIHGENAEGSFWSMVRYAQQAGNDEVCRDIILRALGEVLVSVSVSVSPGQGQDDKATMDRMYDETTLERDVTAHAKTIVELVYQTNESGKKKDLMTLVQLVKEWRSSSKDAPECVQRNKPGSDLNKDECERLIISLLFKDILHPKIVFTAYASTMYIIPGPNAEAFLMSDIACVKVRFPIRESKSKQSKSKQTKATDTNNKDGGWMSTKKKRPLSKRSTTSRSASASVKKKSTSSKTNKSQKKKKESDSKPMKSKVIELLASSSDEDDNNQKYNETINDDENGWMEDEIDDDKKELEIIEPTRKKSRVGRRLKKHVTMKDYSSDDSLDSF